jgi:hypothetical protein
VSQAFDAVYNAGNLLTVTGSADCRCGRTWR